MLHYSQVLKKPCVRQVVLDKWFPRLIQYSVIYNTIIWLSVLTANLCPKILDLRGFDSSIILILRGGILMSIGNFPKCLSPQILVGIISVERLDTQIVCWRFQSLDFARHLRTVFKTSMDHLLIQDLGRVIVGVKQKSREMLVSTPSKVTHLNLSPRTWVWISQLVYQTPPLANPLSDQIGLDITFRLNQYNSVNFRIVLNIKLAAKFGTL